MQDIVLVLNDIRSAHNVGAILRSADAYSVKTVYAVGITPYPTIKNDPRLPHVALRATNHIAKTALGAELSINVWHEVDLAELIKTLKIEKYQIVALEQSKKSIDLRLYKPESKMALIVGNEVNGLSNNILNSVDIILEIPMHGQKESLNVSVATGIALYALSK